MARRTSKLSANRIRSEIREEINRKPSPGDEKALYVTTDGGFLIPHESGIQDAKLVRMEVGESGWPLLQGV